MSTSPPAITSDRLGVVTGAKVFGAISNNSGVVVGDALVRSEPKAVYPVAKHVRIPCPTE